MIKLDYDSVISVNQNINNTTPSALTDSNNFSTPFSVKDILNFVDQSEASPIEFVDCTAMPSYNQESPATHSTPPMMDYCDNRSGLESPQYLYHHHHHHHQPTGYYHPHPSGANSPPPPQFGYSDLCDYNANYYSAPYNNGTYYGSSAASQYPYPPPSQSNFRTIGFESPSAVVALPKKNLTEFSALPQTTTSPGNSSSSLLSSPHAQQLDTMCQELKNESRSRKFFNFSHPELNFI